MARRRQRSQEKLRAPDVTYGTGEDVLVLRGAMTPRTRAAYAEIGGVREDAWARRVEFLFERCRANEEVRDQHFSKGAGYLLYRIIDSCVDASFPMLRKMGNKLDRIEEEIFEGR